MDESPKRDIEKIEVNVAELKEVEKDRAVGWFQVFGNSERELKKYFKEENERVSE